MVLHKLEPAVKVDAYELLTLAAIPAGFEGLLFQNTIAIEATPPWGIAGAAGRYQVLNSYVEGCWHLQRRANESLPGLTLGTGLEDYFDSVSECELGWVQ